MFKRLVALVFAMLMLCSVASAKTSSKDKKKETPSIADQVKDIEIKFTGTSEAGAVKLDGILIDKSFKDKKDSNLANLYVFYTVTTSGKNFSMSSQQTNISFAGSNTYSAYSASSASLLMESYYQSDYITTVTYGTPAKFVTNFHIPKGELKAGRVITFSNPTTEIKDDFSQISVSTDDIITLPSAKHIAQLVDPKGYKSMTKKLTVASKAAQKKVLKGLENYYWSFYVNSISYRIEFMKKGKYKIYSMGINASGKYRVLNGFIECTVSGTGTVTYIPYTMSGKEVNLKPADGYDVRMKYSGPSKVQ